MSSSVFASTTQSVQSFVDLAIDSSQRVLRRFRPPRRIRPTRAGWFALFAPFVLGTAAINASNNLLFLLLGGCLGAIVISGILSEKAVYGVKARVEPLSPIYVGEPARFAVTIERTRFQPLDPPAFGLRVKEQLTRAARRKAGPIEVSVPVVEGRTGRGVGTRTFPMRGRQDLGQFELSTTAPFHLLVKSRDLSTECAVIVRPRRVEVPATLALPVGNADGGHAASSRGAGQDIYGLREREEWDPAHRVHALRSLRLERDVVVETEAMKKPTAWIALANFEGCDKEAFERTLEIAAATAVEWDRAGYAVGFRTASKIFSPMTSDIEEILDAISIVELERGVSGADVEQALWMVPEGTSAPRGAISIASVSRTGTVELTEEDR